MDQDKLNKFRTMAISMGADPKEVDAYIDQKATEQLGVSGQLSPEDINDPSTRLNVTQQLQQSGNVPLSKDEQEQQKEDTLVETLSQSLAQGSITADSVSTTNNLRAKVEARAADLGYKPPEKPEAIEQKKIRTLGESGLRTLEQAQKLYEQDPSLLTKQLLPGKFASRAFDNSLFNTVDALLRLRTGAQAPESEIRRYMLSLGPTVGDSPEVVEQKLNNLYADLAAAAGKESKEIKLNMGSSQKKSGIKEILGAKEQGKKPTFKEATEQMYGMPIEDINKELTSLGLGAALAGNVGKPQIVKKAGEKISKVFKPKYGPDKLTEGIRNIEGGKAVRNEAIEKATGKVRGSKLVTQLNKWAERAKRSEPASAKKIDTLLKNAVKRYKGKNLKATTAKELWDDAAEGFKASGQKGNTVKSGYHRAVRDAVRKELERVAPGFEKGTAQIKQGIESEKILGGIRKGLERKEIKEGLQAPLTKLFNKYGKSAATIAGGAILLRALGIRRD